MTLNPDIDRIDLYHKIQGLEKGPSILNNMGLWSGVDWDSIPANKFVRTPGAFLLKIFINGSDLNAAFDGLTVRTFQTFPIHLGVPRSIATCCSYANPTKSIGTSLPTAKTREGFIDMSELLAFLPPMPTANLSRHFIHTNFVFNIDLLGTLFVPDSKRFVGAVAGKKLCCIDTRFVRLGFIADGQNSSNDSVLSYGLGAPVGIYGLQQVFLSPDDVIPAIKGAFPKSIWS